jgi:glutamine synthetase
VFPDKRFGPDTLVPWLIDWGMDHRGAMGADPPERGRSAQTEVRLGESARLTGSS